MSHPARLSLRAPPHLPFIQGWPGIPSTPQRKSPAVHGTVEVRIGPNPIKAKWVRAEIRKYESSPPGFPSNGETWEHVGEIATLWAAPQGKDWENLEQADFKFHIPLPDNLPPSVDTGKGTGVRYELVAALCYRQKGGMFKKEASPITKISEPIRITKHDLHSAWPIYNIPDTRTVQGPNGELSMTIQRPISAFGPTDRLLFTASLRSTRPKPFKVKGFECTLYEIVIVIPPAPDPQSTKSKKTKQPPQPISKSRAIATTRHAIDESLGKGGEKSARIEMAVPTEKLLLTVENARSLRVRFELEVKAVCDAGIPEMKVGGIKYTVGPFARSHAQQAVRDIGFVETLCPGQNNPANSSNPTTSTSTTPHAGFTPSPQPSFPPNVIPGQLPKASSQPIQGFVSRRKSSDTSTMTTTTATTHDANGYGGRPLSLHQKPLVAFPSASPAPALNRTATGKTIDSSYTSLSSQPEHLMDPNHRYSSEPTTGDDKSKRYSSATAATFGRWDKDLKSAMVDGGGNSSVPPSSPFPSRSTNGSPSGPSQSGTSSRPNNLPPSAWPSAEQEKMRLYNEARSRAVTAQQSTGASLHALGLEESASAPPEYAPRRPEMPNEQYKPPEQPVSSYINRSPVAGSSSDTRPTTLAEDEDASQPKAKDSGAYLSAAEEKEQQRRRFEAAQSRVVSGGSIPPPSADSSQAAPSASRQEQTDEPIPYDAVYPFGPSSGAGPSASGSPSNPPVTMRKAQTQPGPLNEKEQMRRFYEAQDRVARAAARQSSASYSPPAPESERTSPNADAFPTSSNNAQSGTSQSGNPSSSARPLHTDGSKHSLANTKPSTVGLGIGVPAAPGISEKEQMRRFYEAQDRVARSTSGGGPSAGAMDRPPSIESSPAAGPSASSSNSRAPAAYMTAAEEKEMMRKRFEAATAAVAKNRNVSGSSDAPPSFDSAPRASGSTEHQAPPNTSIPGGIGRSSQYMSAADEKEMMRKRFEEATAAVSRSKTPAAPARTTQVPRYSASPPGSPLVRDPTVKAGKAKVMSAVPDGPPPPLPTKPPKEYINLLSPTGGNSLDVSRTGSPADTGPSAVGMAPLGGVLGDANGDLPPGSGSGSAARI